MLLLAFNSLHRSSSTSDFFNAFTAHNIVQISHRAPYTLTAYTANTKQSPQKIAMKNAKAAQLLGEKLHKFS